MNPFGQTCSISAKEKDAWLFVLLVYPSRSGVTAACWHRVCRFIISDFYPVFAIPHPHVFKNGVTAQTCPPSRDVTSSIRSRRGQRPTALQSRTTQKTKNMYQALIGYWRSPPCTNTFSNTTETWELLCGGFLLALTAVQVRAPGSYRLAVAMSPPGPRPPKRKTCSLSETNNSRPPT